jgi:hypothetical protein
LKPDVDTHTSDSVWTRAVAMSRETALPLACVSVGSAVDV